LTLHFDPTNPCLTADCADDADGKDLEPFGFWNRRKRRERRPERLRGSNWPSLRIFLDFDFHCRVTVQAGLNLFGVWTFEIWDLVRRISISAIREISGQKLPWLQLCRARIIANFSVELMP
jgi:hypothetical protein